ncbi:MAG: ABC transporter ATP-binding protein [bacterium]
MSSKQAVISVSGLGKTYRSPAGEVEVLRGIDLEVEKGEMLAVVGASGVGKSTLLHVLGALDHPTSGTVSYFGKDIFKKSEPDLAAFRNKNIGFVFQFHHLLPEFSALENVMMPRLMAKVSPKEAEKQAGEILDQVGLSPRTSHKPGELSGGEQQRTALARALVNRPQVVLADEPTGNLDQETSGRIFDLMSGLNRELGITFILVTHNEGLAGSCHRTLRLVGNRLSPL